MPKFSVTVYLDVHGLSEVVEVETKDKDEARTLAYDQLAEMMDQFTQQKVWEAGYETDTEVDEIR